MKTFWNIDKNLTALNEWQPNCWVQVTCPTDEDQRLLEEEFKIPDYFLSDISDTDERARYEYDDGWMLIILRIPYVKEIRSRTPYTTVPLGIIHKRDVTITVCFYETNMMIDFVSYQQKRGEGFTDYVDMIFRLFLSSAVWYLKRLKQINSLIEKAKRNLDHGVNNESLIGLSRLQDSLTYFTTSIRGNETLLSKLKFKLQVDELDADLIEDVNIEMTQARETTSIYSDILESTMDTYSSIINNNMNTTMRTLTSISIVMMLPTLISSLFGMNLINGMEESPYGFAFALVLSFIVSGLSWGKLNMNLQLLADEGEQEPPQDTNNETGGPAQQPPMSQDELNKLVEEKAKEMAKDIASRNIVKEKRKYKEMLESLQNDKAQLESEKLAKMSEADKTAYQISELNKKLEEMQKQSSEKEKAFEFERLTNQTKDLLVEKGLPGALANMVMAGADGEAEAIQKNIASLQEYVNQAIDAGVEARIKASSGTPRAVKTSKGGFTLEDIKKMSPSEINAHWDEISKQGILK